MWEARYEARRRRRAVVGRRAVRSECESLLCCGRADVFTGVEVAVVVVWVRTGGGGGEAGLLLTMPGSRRRSSWKCTRAATMSLENSRGPWVPARIGAVKRGQRASHAWRKVGRVRAAARVRASWTAEVKRAQSSAVSSGVVLGRAGGGVRARMETNSVLL